MIDGRWLTANGVAGFWPANAVGDDIVLWTGETRTTPLLTWRNLRQQNERPAGKPNYCLADFVAPAATGVARLRRRVRGHRPASASRSGSPRSRRATTTIRR